MKRFKTAKSNMYSYRSLIISIVLFLTVIILFYWGIRSLSDNTEEKEMHFLQNALNQSVTQCYAVEGFYPESLAYLEEHYHITYDRDRFFIDYQPQGENIFPVITIIPKSEP